MFHKPDNFPLLWSKCAQHSTEYTSMYQPYKWFQFTSKTQNIHHPWYLAHAISDYENQYNYCFNQTHLWNELHDVLPLNILQSPMYDITINLADHHKTDIQGYIQKLILTHGDVHPPIPIVEVGIYYNATETHQIWIRLWSHQTNAMFTKPLKHMPNLSYSSYPGYRGNHQRWNICVRSSCQDCQWTTKSCIWFP